MTPCFADPFQTDLREIGDSVFPTESSRNKYEVPKTGIVLQVVKIVRNVAAPKANQDSKFAPRLLKIQFTDGQNQFSGIELEHLSLLSLRDTKPGTKLFFRPGAVIQIAQDLLLLKASYFEVLGGHVQDMVDKWEVAQRYSKYSAGIRNVAQQAPPWIAFGQKIDRKALNLNKKSLGGGSGSGENKDGEEDKEDVAFDNQRKEAIAEAQKLEPKQRVFLDGAKKIAHHNVQKIVDKGYSEEVAKEALKYTRNDLSKALANLKRGNAEGDEGGDGRFRSNAGRGGRGGGRGGGGRGGRRGGRFGGDHDDEGEEFMARPSEKISLFDFIGDKLPPEIKNAAPASKPAAVPSATTHPSGGFNRAPSYGENRGNRFSASHHEGGRGGSHRFDRENNNSRGNPRFNNTRPQQDFGHRPPPATSSTGHQNSHPRHDSSRGNHHQQRNERNSHRERNGEGGALNLARDMERMSLSNNNYSRQPHAQASSAGNHHRQQPPPPRNHQQNPHHKQQERFNSNAAFPTLDNTRRTPGFQNKESNEAAKKFLEQSDQQPMLSQGGPHFKQNHRGPATKPSATTVPQIPDTPSGWNWKLGDRCMAKYWEDGKVSVED